MRPVLYIAGPYTLGDPAANTHAAVRLASDLMDLRLAWPVVPHLSLLWQTIAPRPDRDWYQLDLAILERCDGLIRIPGESIGADREVAHAELIGMPTLTDLARGVIPWIEQTWNPNDQGAA